MCHALKGASTVLFGRLPETRLAGVHTTQHQPIEAITRRRLLSSLLAATPIAIGLAGCESAASTQEPRRQPFRARLRRLAEARWPHRMQVRGTPVGGLSAIDFNSKKDEYLLLSDDRSEEAPARFYTARWPEPTAVAPAPKGVVFLQPSTGGAWLAMENSLIEDGSVPTLDAACGRCRFTQIDLDSGITSRQIAYVPDAIPLRPAVPGGFADIGVSEVLMIDAHRMLVLERAYAAGVGNSLRFYEIDTRCASDVLALNALTPSNHRSASKTLGLSRLDNSEGMCWGPSLANGHRTLVVVSDDNFNPLQITQFAAFEFIDRP